MPNAPQAAADFVSGLTQRRRGPPGTPGIATETIPADGRRHRQMRIGIINDDMPFLVDSVAAEIAAHSLSISRVLHPVAAVARDANGQLTAIGARGASGNESIIYMEMERADARVRRQLEDGIADLLSKVRAAVVDWSAMRATLAADSEVLGGQEGGALLDWFGDNKLTLLGHGLYKADDSIAEARGIATSIGDSLLSTAARKRARLWFDKGGEAPLLLKSNVISPVHRRVPVELVVVPRGKDLSIHAGLWTSAAMNEPPLEIPVLRERLGRLQAKLGFDPSGHAGKTLTHAITSLQRDLLIAMDDEALESVALTAMSLVDRPRPAIAITRSPLARHLHAFVWLPRDELSTSRRLAITDMIAKASDAPVLSWAMDLDDSGIVLIRLTLDIRDGGGMPDVAALNVALETMVRGWRSAVEEALSKLDGVNATRMALRFADGFPAAYRDGAGAEEAAEDICRLAALHETAERRTRLYRNPGDAESMFRLKIYSLGPVALSDAVPALENFGFRVLEELPTLIGPGGELGHIHRFILQLPEGQAADALVHRASVLESAFGAVLEGSAENDRFNQLMVSAALDQRSVVLFRALFRYLRQTGMPYSLQTVADVLRRAAPIARDLVSLFDARHDPARKGDGEKAAHAASTAIDRGLAGVSAIDDDRILRLYRGVINATLRTNMFAAAASEALAFKLDSALVPNLPDPRPWREVFVYSPRVEGIHLRAGPVARGGLRWSDRRDDFRTEILGLMKAQRVKNAVIVPTGAKGGFYPKMLPDPVRQPRCLAGGRDGELPHLHPHAPFDHRQSGEGQGRPPGRRRHS